jgi:TolA-binding protein
MAAGEYEKIIDEANEILMKGTARQPADVALYALGEVYAYHDFKGRDYTLSRAYFDRLIKNFPDSTLTSEAELYLSLFNALDAKEKATVVRIQTAPTKKYPVAEKPPVAPSPPADRIVEDKNFEGAIQKNLDTLDTYGMNPPADSALYNLGLIYAHNDNPAKDLHKSQVYFNVLATQFPKSDYAEEARIWLGLFETIDKIQQIDDDIEQQKKQLTQ